MPGPTESAATLRELTATESPQKLAWLRTGNVNDALETFCAKSGLRVPDRRELESPSRRSTSPTHNVKRAFSYLFFQDWGALEHEVQTFLDYLPAWSNDEEKLDFLSERLLAASTRTKSRSMTPRVEIQSSAFSKPTVPRTWLSTDGTAAIAALSSPTMSIRHAPNGTLPDSCEVHRSALGLQSGETSKNTSFWSQPPGEPVSTATSVNTSLEANDGSNDSGTQELDFPISAGFESFLGNDGANDYGTQETAFAVSSGFESSMVADTSLVDKFKAVADSNAHHSGVNQFQGANSTAIGQHHQLAGNSEHGYTKSKLNAELRTGGVDPAISPFNPARRASAQGTREHCRVKKIAQDGLSHITLPRSFFTLPLALRLEAQRILQTGHLTPTELEQNWTAPRTHLSLQHFARELGVQYQPGQATDFQDHDICATLRWSETSNSADPLFELFFLCPQSDKSISFQRKFGRHRFLQVDIPSLSRIPRHMGLAGQKAAIERRLLELLGKEQCLLGRKWRCFLAQPKKKKMTMRASSDPDSKIAGATQLMFFAVSSECEVDQLLPMSIVDVVDFAVPLLENKDQPACKAYARLDLSASKTVAGFEFSPGELKYDHEGELDIFASNEPGDTRYNDPDSRFDFSEPFDKNAKVILSDGQCWISPWAMRQIQLRFGLTRLPSVIQARVFGSKGLWYLSSRDAPPMEKPQGPLLGISRSQIKAAQKHCNFTECYDPESLTMNVVRWSHPPQASKLYTDYLPILIDRGVSRQRLRDFVRRQAQREADQFLVALQDRRKLRFWTAQNCIGEQMDRTEIGTIGNFPKSTADQIINMLDSSFEPAQNLYLSDQTRKLAKAQFDLCKKFFKIYVPKSTMLLGIADPSGCLKPGEVHVSFSEMFQDIETGEEWPNLYEMDALVARNPALRPSDIQKVRLVDKPELAHLQDVVIFPAKGKRSLASKLQGGDYDGDTFWLCWEPDLTEHFQNAPAPWDLPDPESYGIQVDKEKLGAVLGLEDQASGMPNEENVNRWIMDQIEHRMRGSLLGIVTLAHGRALYHEGNLLHPIVTMLADLHDHLVDADKRGFRFGNAAWDDFKKRYVIPVYSKPAYRDLLGFDEEDEEGLNRIGPKPEPKEGNIIDCLHFFELAEVFDKALDDADKITNNACTADPDLNKLYDEIFESAGKDSALRQELQWMRRKLSAIVAGWKCSTALIYETPSSTRKASFDWDALRLKFWTEFEALSPDQPSHPTITEWLRCIGHSPTTWDFLKASALAKFHHSSRSLLYTIAGDKLCRLKARFSGGTRELTRAAFLDLKPRKIKAKRARRELSDGEFDGEDALADENETAAQKQKFS